MRQTLIPHKVSSYQLWTFRFIRSRVTLCLSSYLLQPILQCSGRGEDECRWWIVTSQSGTEFVNTSNKYRKTSRSARSSWRSKRANSNPGHLGGGDATPSNTWPHGDDSRPAINSCFFKRKLEESYIRNWAAQNDNAWEAIEKRFWARTRW